MSWGYEVSVGRGEKKIMIAFAALVNNVPGRTRVGWESHFKSISVTVGLITGKKGKILIITYDSFQK